MRLWRILLPSNAMNAHLARLQVGRWHGDDPTMQATGILLLVLLIVIMTTLVNRLF